MSNPFDYYDQIRKQQIHFNKIINPQLRVPKHEAYKPVKAKIQQTRQKERTKKQASIQRENNHIMKKLFSINMRKPTLGLSHSTPSFSLPPIPQHDRQNNLIAQKLISSKSSINVKNQLKDYHQKEKLKKNISKYQSLEGYNGEAVVDRKKYIAELMMLKKLKLAEQTESRVKSYIGRGSEGGSRVTLNGRDMREERQFYTNR